MASQKARLRSQSGEIAHAAKVKRLRPKLDIATASSRLTSDEMDRVTKVEKSDVDLDPRKPERSAWLAASFVELESKDFEKRFYALCRIENALKDIVMGESPEVSTGFTAYLLEHGIVDHIILLLEAAETTGDVYLVAGGLGSRKERHLARKLGLVHVFSKVRVCCDLVQSLVTDARTARFIRKAVPDLTGILERIYLAEDPVCMAQERKGKCVDVGKQFFAVREVEKNSSLSALGNLTMWSTAQEKALIASRKVLFGQVMKDATNETDFAHQIINRIITFSYHIVFLPEFPPSLFEDFLRVAFIAMEISDSVEIVKMAFGLVSNLFLYEKVTAEQLTSTKSQTVFLVPLLAMAACPRLDEQIRPNVHEVICMLDGSFRPIIASENATGEFQKLAAANSKVIARMKQLCALYAASQRATFQSPELSEGWDGLRKSSCTTRMITTKDKAELFYDIPKEELEAQRRPCRQCSRSSCPNTESVSREFKLCSNCRMARSTAHENVRSLRGRKATAIGADQEAGAAPSRERRAEKELPLKVE